MSRIVKEWQCLAHGDFESAEQRCPRGCGASMVLRAFRTPVSIGSNIRKNTDATFQALADDLGLTDMNNRSGEGMRMADHNAHKRLRQATELALHAPNGGRTGKGEDLSQYFRPLAEKFRSSATAVPIGDVTTTNDTRASNGALYRDPSTGIINVGAGIPLAKPKAEIQAPAFNGAHLGLPGT